MRRDIFLFVLCLCPALLFAQVNPKLEQGSKAMLFNFSGLSSLNATSFNGGIGGKYYISPTRAIRGSIQLTTASQDVPNNTEAGQDGEISGSTFGLSAAIEFHRGSGRISPYFGGGLGFSTTSTEDESPTFSDAALQTVVENDVAGENINGMFFRGQSRFDLFGMAGIEFFIMNELSLAAEYRLTIYNSSGKDQVITQGENTQEFETGGVSGFEISTAGFLTLSIYFD